MSDPEIKGELENRIDILKMKLEEIQSDCQNGMMSPK